MWIVGMRGARGVLDFASTQDIPIERVKKVVNM